MIACWLNTNEADEPYKLHRYGITWPYYDIRDTRLTPGYLDSVKAVGGYAGIGFYVASSWGYEGQPELMASDTDKALRRIGWRQNPPVMFDVEVDDLVPFVLSLLGAWRTLRPTRTTDLTIEGHKGGLFRPADVINTVAKVRWVVPQCYDAEVTPWDTWAICADLYEAGFPFGKVRPFYSAKGLTPWFGSPDGFVFNQAELP